MKGSTLTTSSASRVSFIAIDFETANRDQASVCQVGIAKVVDGEIVESTSWLVKPPTGLSDFEPRFIDIHGITPAEVKRSGISWQESLQRIFSFAGDLPFVAHNTSFDKTVYRRASERVGAAVPAMEWFDTLVLARRHVAAPNHKLPTVAKALSLPDFSHHQAEADAITSARIALAISHRQQLHTVQELWARPVGNIRTPSRQRRRSTPQRFSRVGDLPTANTEAHPSHPLFGHHVVITGDVDGFSRDEFIIKVAELGGQPQLNVTKATTMLIVAAHQYLGVDYDHSNGTGKEKKAAEYKAAGQRIEFVGAKMALEYLTASIPAIKQRPAQRPRPAQVEIPPTETAPVAGNLPFKPAKQPSKPPESSPIPAPTIRPRSAPLPSETIPKLGPSHQDAASTTPRSQHPRKPAYRLPRIVIAGISWTLLVVAAICVALFLIASTAVLFSGDYPEVTFFSWVIGLVFIVPLLSLPGLLGYFLLRRHKKHQRRGLNV